MAFIDFSLEFTSRYDCAEAKKICNKMLIDHSFDIKIADDVKNRIIAIKRKNDVLFINSFLPVIRIDFCKNDCGTGIRTTFQLRRMVKVLLCIYIIVAIAFEVCIINLYLQNDLASPFLLLLPILLVLYALVLSYLGLRTMSRHIKSCLLSLLAHRGQGDDSTGDGSVC